LTSTEESYNGGAIHVGIPSEKEFFIESCIFEYIKSNGNGGAIYCNGGGLLYIKKTSFSYCEGKDGGCIYIEGFLK
jgi:predicted outer membrane repeat protein